MNIVIYGSQYGTAKRYAEELSNRLGFELKSYEEVADVNLYDTIIYVGEHSDRTKIGQTGQ